MKGFEIFVVRRTLHNSIDCRVISDNKSRFNGLIFALIYTIEPNTNALDNFREKYEGMNGTHFRLPR